MSRETLLADADRMRARTRENGVDLTVSPDGRYWAFTFTRKPVEGEPLRHKPRRAEWWPERAYSGKNLVFDGHYKKGVGAATIDEVWNWIVERWFVPTVMSGEQILHDVLDMMDAVKAIEKGPLLPADHPAIVEFNSSFSPTPTTKNEDDDVRDPAEGFSRG